MKRISITEEAYRAIVDTLPIGSVGVEPERSNLGRLLIWVEEPWVIKLLELRQKGEEVSDVIPRLAGQSAPR